MAQRHHHYEQAFETYLRSRRVPYVAVDEAKKALIPDGQPLIISAPGDAAPAALKSFDFVVYGHASNLLVEIKGRKIARRALAAGLAGPASRSRLESWVTLDDVNSLDAWGRLFGGQFVPAFVFVYWCDEQPPDALFEEIFEHRGRWYALRAITLADYRGAMRTRSLRWRTVHLPAASFDRLSRPFAPGPSSPVFAEMPPELPILDPL